MAHRRRPETLFAAKWAAKDRRATEEARHRFAGIENEQRHYSMDSNSLRHSLPSLTDDVIPDYR